MKNPDIRTTVIPRILISCQVERATSPKVQKTTMASSVSVARYCISMVAEPNREDRATPARMTASADSCLSRARTRMMNVAPMAPAKAYTVTDTSWDPITTTDRAAPKAAPWLIPRVAGDPRGFFSNDWMPRPDSAMPQPQTIAATIRGRRISATTSRTVSSPPPVMARKISVRVIS
ncbi:MAG: hypothetical protein U5K27_12960 [Desulfotignum sp.]|nr:hypothetical protein [Desulfotignum sp.]